MVTPTCRRTVPAVGAGHRLARELAHLGPTDFWGERRDLKLALEVPSRRESGLLSVLGHGSSVVISRNQLCPVAFRAVAPCRPLVYALLARLPPGEGRREPGSGVAHRYIKRSGRPLGRGAETGAGRAAR